MVMVGVLTAQPLRFFSGQAFNPLIGFEVILDPECFARGVHPLKRMRAKAVHVPV